MIFFDGSRVRSIKFGERDVLNVYFEGVSVFNVTSLSDEQTGGDVPQADVLSEEE